MLENEATVILKNGEQYVTPQANIENVRRMLAGKYDRIIFPGETDEEETGEVTIRKKGGRPKKTN